MEDSGIDSDKDMKVRFFTLILLPWNNLMQRLIIRFPPTHQQNKHVAVDDSENSDEVIFQGNTAGGQLHSSVTTDPTKPFTKERLNSCRALQKKLELKVERAKKNYRQLHQSDEGVDWDVVCITQPQTSNLIPISRLQFPGREDNHNLIEYKEVNNDGDPEDDLGREEARFFANKHKKTVKQDLSDTFSIQEMTIESDSDESGSDTLELLPPADAQYWDRVLSVIPCCATREL